MEPLQGIAEKKQRAPWYNMEAGVTDVMLRQSVGSPKDYNSRNSRRTSSKLGNTQVITQQHMTQDIFDSQT